MDRFQVNTMLRTSEVVSGANLAGARALPGSIFSFVPAHGGSRAGAVAEQLSRTLAEGFGLAVLLANFDDRGYSLWRRGGPPRRLDGHTWGAFVSKVNGVEVLQGREVHPRKLRQLLDHARENYDIVCVDLTGAKDSHALEALRASESIFIVGASDPAALEGVNDKRDWLRSNDLIEQCGVLLERVPNGANAREAEDYTGLPVCSLVNDYEQIAQLAGWLCASTDFESMGEPMYALAG